MRLEKSRSGMHHLDGRPTAQKKSAMKQRLVSVFSRPQPPVTVAVDYPKSGELVVSREYTLRISAAAPDSVEVSIDDQAWQPCRPAEGFWWLDWSGYRAGPHSVLARVSLQKGRKTLSARRAFSVELT